MSVSLRSQWPQVVGQAWADAEFRSNLLADPEGTLTQLGIDVPRGHQIRVFEDAPGQTHLVLPLPPSSLGDLAQLDSTSAASPQGKGVFAQTTHGGPEWEGTTHEGTTHEGTTHEGTTCPASAGNGIRRRSPSGENKWRNSARTTPRKRRCPSSEDTYWSTFPCPSSAKN